MSAILEIDIFSDIICPWCYIGIKHLEQAFAQRPHLTPRYRWRSFLLNPSMPPEGMERQAYLNAKFGHSSAAVYGKIALAGRECGIDFQFSKIKNTPDTRPIHKLLIASGEKAESLSQLFYQAYFLEGRDIANRQVQSDIAKRAGLSLELLEREEESAKKQLEKDLKSGQDMDIEGVPYLVFAGSFSLAGAYPPDILLKTIDAAIRPR